MIPLLKNRTACIVVLIGFILSSSCAFRLRNISGPYTLAFVQEVHIDEGRQNNDGGSEPAYEEKESMNFVGIFPKNNDTVKIFRLKDDITDRPDRHSFWLEKNVENNSVVFHSSEGNELKVAFKGKNTIAVGNDVFTVNDAYYAFLEKKVLNERSVFDLSWLLKDGYGDYAPFFELLNKNWLNLKEDKNHKIIRVLVKSKNMQVPEDKFYTWTVYYKYDKSGELQSIAGKRFNKERLGEDEKYINYSVEVNQDRYTSAGLLYKNKKTLFDSVSVTWEQFSTASTFRYVHYQSKLKLKVADKKPESAAEIFELLDIEKNDLK